MPIRSNADTDTNNEPFNTILWDVGGTLAFRVVDWLTSGRKAMERAGLDPAALTTERYEEAMKFFAENEDEWRTPALERAGYERIAEIMCGGRVDDKSMQRLVDELSTYPKDFQVTPGVTRVLERLNDLGYRQAVVSNWPPSLRNFLAWHQLDQYFELIVVSGEEGVAKPDPELFHRATNRLGVDPRRSLYIGNDPQFDIGPSRRVGITPVHFDPERHFPGADAYDVEQLSRVLAETLRLPQVW